MKAHSEPRSQRQNRSSRSDNCRACGACCFSQLDRYIRVTGDDYQELGEAAAEFTVFIENRCYMRLRRGACAALSVSREGEFTCSIYERRPAICRELEPGGPACLAERERKADWAQKAVLAAV